MDEPSRRQRNGSHQPRSDRQNGGRAVATVEPDRSTRAVTTVDNPLPPDHLVSPEERRYREELRAFVQSQHAGDEDPWRTFLGPLLDAEQVRSLLGVPSLEAVDNLVRAKRVLALPTSTDEVFYPAFQFDRDGQPYPAIAMIIRILDDVAVTPYTIASWLKSPNDYLEGESPIGWIELGRDQDRVLQEAKYAAEHMAHF